MFASIRLPKKSRRGEDTKKWFLLATIVALLLQAGCNNESGITEISNVPKIEFTDPAGDATDIAVDVSIVATFNNEMDPSTITDSSFTLRRDTAFVTGTISYTDSSAIFKPVKNLEFESNYTATITSDVQSLSGDAMDDQYEWNFTTVDKPEENDTTPPRITATTPDNEAEEVSINSAVIATFNEAMNESTINTTTFSLRSGSTPISGSVTYSDNQATFSPSNSLEFNNTYTATITTSATDTAGNSLTEDYSWSFTTGDQPDNTAPRITDTDPSDNEQDISVSSTISVDFNEAINTSSISSSTFIVEGDTRVSGAFSFSENNESVTFTPSGNLSFETTYTARVTTGVEDLAGNNLENNFSWSFTTGAEPDTEPPRIESRDPDDGARNVSIETDITVTFSEAITASNPGNAFSLSLGGSTVSGDVDISGSTITFTPSSNLDYESSYTAKVTTDVQDLAGNSLQNEAEWSFETEEEPDLTSPEILSVNPTNNEENVSIDTEISATFDEPLNDATVNDSNFYLELDGDRVSGSVSRSGDTIIFSPSNDLDYESTYTATISTGIQDMAGNSLEDSEVWSFTTEEAPDDTPPSVSSTSPVGGSDNVTIETNISVTFNESITASDPDDTIEISPSVDGSADISGNTITFTPSDNLAYETTYTLKVTTAVEDLAGNSLEEDFEWEFTTEEEPDNTAPEVSSISPTDGATDVPITIDEITVSFNEDMNSDTFDKDTFLLIQDGDEIDGDVPSFVGNTARFIPNDDLEYSTSYTAIVSGDVEDLAGNSLGSDFEWSFTTEAEPDSDDDNGDDDD